MKHIAVFGAGKSSGWLIEYLIAHLSSNQWQLTVADSNAAAAAAHLSDCPSAQASCFNVEEKEPRQQLIRAADLVISLLPPHLHLLVATDCVALGKHLITASYIQPGIKLLEPQARDKGVLLLCEMGLDPGIDHMSAMKVLDRLRGQGARITGFRSYCGGLVAPSNDDNPWRYKISWNPRNIVLAGKQGARFIEDDREQQLAYPELFDPTRRVDIPGLGELSWYPNRDSLAYRDIYRLAEAHSLIRATLRYPCFCAGWRQLVALNFTSEELQYDTDGMSLQDFFREHFKRQGLSMDDDRQLNNVLASSPGFDAQLACLGLYDTTTFINQGICSAASVLQFALEKKLVLEPNQKDMVVMLHRIGYEWQGRSETISSCLILEGDSDTRTAMAKTVGLSLAIAAVLVLQGKISARGLHIPVLPEIYIPVLSALEQCGISFTEHHRLRYDRKRGS